MPDSSIPLPYAEPGTARPVQSLFASRVELGSTLGTLALLLVIMPGLYLAGAIDIIVLNQLGRFLAYAIAAIGIDLIWGYCGILTLCQAMFFCLGGYAIGMHMALHGPLDGDGIPRCLYVVTSVVEGFQLPAFWRPFQTLGMSLLLVVLVPGVIAFLFGYFAFRSRVRGVYFSIITQATTLGACLIFRRNETRLCGTNGLTNFVTLGGLDLSKPSTKLFLYFLTVAVLIAAFLFCRWLVVTRLGRLFVAVRDNESRLRFAGYQPVTVKAFVFTLGAILAAIGGMLYTPQNGIITPYKMEPIESILMVVWIAVGGRGTLAGAVVGSLLVNYLSSFLTTIYPAAWPFVLGAIFVAVVLFLPEGIVGTWRRWTRGDARARAGQSLPDAPPATLPTGAVNGGAA